MRHTLESLTLVLSLVVASAQGAVVIDMGSVGNPKNVFDSTGYGRVEYTYQIGKYEVTNAQYCEFLNAKATVSDPHGLWNRYMAEAYDGINYGGIQREETGIATVPYKYTVKSPEWGSRPVNFVSFWDAARFCNWLHNGQGNGDTETGAYTGIDNQSAFARQADAKFFLPTENEWYKAAYYDPDKMGGAGYWNYATGTDTAPSAVAPPGDRVAPLEGKFGSANYSYVDPVYYSTPVGAYADSKSPYGTFDQSGNVWEWNETRIGSARGLRGGSSFNDASALAVTFRHSSGPETEFRTAGFRVASPVPEPSTIVTLLLGVIGVAAWKRRRLSGKTIRSAASLPCAGHPGNPR